ncbi:MAG: hypothetical protein M1833_001455 [Piccolia ochrophora]|nr:MAG: hypothetical protein M1833_001455 [Piccolia ochrophora]
MFISTKSLPPVLLSISTFRVNDRSSISLGLNSLRHAGGVNSLENFARSWQRAVGFHEITPRRPSLLFTDESSQDGDEFRRSDEEQGGPQRSLIRAQIESQGRSEQAIEDTDESGEGVDASRGEPRSSNKALGERSHDNIFAIAPHLASPFASSGTSYGSLSSRLNESSMQHAGRLWREQQATGAHEPDKEREPLLVRRVEREDGRVVNVVVGQSTLPQTVFNSVNVLIGVGLLSLPLGVKYSGWLLGMVILLFCAIVTLYTARIMAKCLDVDGTLVTYADLAYISFGARARVITSILFSIELLGTCVALVVLFADSLDALIPGLGVIEWKIICGLILIPLGFLPLQVLSFSSVLGIISCLGIVTIIFVDGLLKEHTPGSLREPAATYMFPTNWLTLPLSFGLLMSPWGGHGVFPNIYRDMRHPRKYTKGLKITYTFTYLLDLSMAVSGLLMFGDGVRDEVTSNLLLTSGYPRALNICVVVFIAIVPLTKIPLNTRPIISTLEVFAGLDARAVSSAQSLVGMSGLTRGILRYTIRILTIVVCVILAVIFPAFDRIMALMGSALCFTICVILPVAFYLKVFGKELSLKERIVDYILIAICSIMALLGTIWAFLPREMIGAA